MRMPLKVVKMSENESTIIPPEGLTDRRQGSWQKRKCGQSNRKCGEVSEIVWW